MPDGFPVNLLAKGTSRQSYMGRNMIMKMPMKDCNPAAGILKLGPIDRSSVTPCLVKKVEICAKTIPKTKFVAHIGKSLSNDFASSTSLLLVIVPGNFELSQGRRALSRNLTKRGFLLR
ncbi:hypothetical protein KSS87_020667 [Heliosperma pusillum]|nr:hypothetical protein KSS87_020667 [Heliosperma pusillum]